MNELASVSALLDELAPEVLGEAPAWDDVLARVGRSPRARGGRRVVALAAAVAAALAVVAIALAAGAFHRFSAWVGSSPGSQAPAADQRGFAHRNAAAFARFPRGTTVRLLHRVTVAGKRFNLLGFRSGDALCLRVVRADLPDARGANGCSGLPELQQSAAPAVVLDDLWFTFGRPARLAAGVFGFADDTVRRVDVVRERSGVQSVPVRDNAFLALVGHASGTVASPPPQDPITGVYAVRTDGSRVRLAYVGGAGNTTTQPPPKPPFFLGPAPITVGQLPGPAKPAVRYRTGTIAWLDRRAKLGEPYALQRRYRRHFGALLFARAIQPDPARPDRIAVMLVHLAPHAFGPGTSRKPVVCFSPIQALQSIGSTSCLRAGSMRSPIAYMSVWPSQVAHVGGIAVDAVASIKVFLANGRVIPAQLRDNTFVVDVPGSIASKIVSYDKAGRVLSVGIVNGPPPRYQRCPAPIVPSSVGPARPWERLDLATGRLDGARILGATETEVVAALGPPARIMRNTVVNGRRIPDYLYGSASQATATQIQFGRSNGRTVAVGIMFETPRLVEARLGHILARDPQAVQAAIERTYPAYRLAAGYGTLDAHGCLFRANRGRLGTHVMLTLGLGSRTGRALWLDLRRGY